MYYTKLMVKSFLHRGIENFFRTGKTSDIQTNHAAKLRLILTNLDAAEKPDDMDLPGLASHPLKGKRKNIWAVKINRNWRITFRFSGRDTELVNYEDYH